MKEIIITAPFEHSMIPPTKGLVEKIKQLTGLEAHPRDKGLQVADPVTIVLYGTEEHLRVLKTAGLNACFA